VKHHIIPLHEWKKRFNPKATRADKELNAPDNVVVLTIEQHAQVHQFLYEQYGRWEDRLAWKGLTGGIGTESILAEKQRLNGSRSGLLIKGIPKSQDHKNALKSASRKRWDSEQGKKEIDKMARNYKVICPSGLVMVIRNLTQFCREHNLPIQNMTHVAKGKRKHCKHYWCEEIG
jgi:hypothetical protein